MKFTQRFLRRSLSNSSTESQNSFSADDFLNDSIEEEASPALQSTTASLTSSFRRPSLASQEKTSTRFRTYGTCKRA
eukprot:m.29797 g.29797  ORF g.29797 m.29797 type:complete len:77 (+) comp11976_c0_seq1:1479-1709(+)